MLLLWQVPYYSPARHTPSNRQTRYYLKPVYRNVSDMHYHTSL